MPGVNLRSSLREKAADHEAGCPTDVVQFAVGVIGHQKRV
jgi:hypothetical protein